MATKASKKPKLADARRRRGSNAVDTLIERTLDSRPGLAERWQSLEPRRHLANALVAMRKKAGLTQIELGERTGWNQAFVSRVESVTGPQPSTDTIARYAKACGAVAGFVFGEVSRNALEITGGVTLSSESGGGGEDDRNHLGVFERLGPESVPLARAAKRRA